MIHNKKACISTSYTGLKQPLGESNPCFEDENLASSPLDEGAFHFKKKGLSEPPFKAWQRYNFQDFFKKCSYFRILKKFSN